jgi:hypothetical protein
MFVNSMEAVEIDVLKQIQSDLSFIKQKVSIIEEEVDAISGDIHELRPEYVKKLQEIEKKGKFLSFKNVDELRKSIESSEREDLFLFKMFRADSNGKKKFG